MKDCEKSSQWELLVKWTCKGDSTTTLASREAIQTISVYNGVERNEGGGPSVDMWEAIGSLITLFHWSSDIKYK